MNSKEKQKRLLDIGLQIQHGADPEAFKDELDQILGTDYEERDFEAYVSWEDAYRNSTD
jgi:hypothetical protein